LGPSIDAERRFRARVRKAREALANPAEKKIDAC
jgi:hypothetical protein